MKIYLPKITKAKVTHFFLPRKGEFCHLPDVPSGSIHMHTRYSGSRIRAFLITAVCVKLKYAGQHM